MSDSVVRLTTTQVARFVARGFLRFDAIVPPEINEQFMAEAGGFAPPQAGRRPLRVFFEGLAANAIPEVPAGAPLDQVYGRETAIARMLQVPEVAGAVRSLLGDDPVFDHHFLHVTLPPAYHEAGGAENLPQHTHQDSTIDPRLAFDIQLLYFPAEVTRAMGGTRFVPGTHLHKVSEVAVGRYQNIRGQQHVVCPAGTLIVFHHGIWHGAGVNHADRPRYMFKIRLRAGGDQTRRWDVGDLPPGPSPRPIFYLKSQPDPESVESILTAREPWFEADTGRLEIINRIRLWRYLTGDDGYDADFWMSRLEGPETNTGA